MAVCMFIFDFNAIFDKEITVTEKTYPKDKLEALLDKEIKD